VLHTLSREQHRDRGKAPAPLAGLRGMAATVDIEAGEALVSLPMSAALLVTPKQRCPFPDFCSPAFYVSKPWCAGSLVSAAAWHCGALF